MSRPTLKTCDVDNDHGGRPLYVDGDGNCLIMDYLAYRQARIHLLPMELLVRICHPRTRFQAPHMIMYIIIIINMSFIPRNRSDTPTEIIAAMLLL